MSIKRRTALNLPKLCIDTQISWPGSELNFQKGIFRELTTTATGGRAESEGMARSMCRSVLHLFRYYDMDSACCQAICPPTHPQTIVFDAVFIVRILGFEESICDACRQNGRLFPHVLG
jgi:hypothetical protein